MIAQGRQLLCLDLGDPVHHLSFVDGTARRSVEHLPSLVGIDLGPGEELDDLDVAQVFQVGVAPTTTLVLDASQCPADDHELGGLCLGPPSFSPNDRSRHEYRRQRLALVDAAAGDLA